MKILLKWKKKNRKAQTQELKFMKNDKTLKITELSK